MMTAERAPGISSPRREHRRMDAAGAVPAPARYPVDFDDRLVEEAVLLGVDRADAARLARFHGERDLLYELADEDFREQRFRALHASWFVSLGLGATLREALAAEPSVVAGTRRCRVLRAAHRGEEYADLADSRAAKEADGGAARPVLLVRLLPRSLLEAEALKPWLRRELLHVADLLDPAFGFDRSASLSPGEPGLENLVRRRYRLLWEVTVDGRLAAAGELPPAVEELRRGEFRSAFPMLGDSAPAGFERLFRGPRPSHAELAARARDPRGLGGAGPGTAGRCPVCRMPCQALVYGPQVEEPALVASVRESASDWGPAAGLCRQCLDLFRGKHRTTDRT